MPIPISWINHSIIYHMMIVIKKVLEFSLQQISMYVKAAYTNSAKSDMEYIRGQCTMEYQIFPNILILLHCVPLYVCRLCINYQDLNADVLGMAALRMLLLTFISHFVIDFLSIRKVIIFSATATGGRHPLRPCLIYQNAAN